jgi:myo-inositol-1(or 4)-monophosphatase
LSDETDRVNVPLMLSSQVDVLRDAAIEAAHASGRVLMRRFRKKLRINEKPGAGIVTNADVESERVAIRILKKARPDFGILAEESAEKPAKSPGRWLLDPLDGTTNYAHGLSNFCVSIAAEWNGAVVVGVTYQPAVDDLYVAVRGRGAFVNGKPIRVSTTHRLKDTLLTTGFSSRQDLWLTQELRIFEQVSRAASGVRRPGSAALDMACVARGLYDGFWERGLAPWDVAAGSLLIEEAGGAVSDFSGKALQLDSGQVLCSNGLIHRELIRKGGFNHPQKPAFKRKARDGKIFLETQFVS